MTMLKLAEPSSKNAREPQHPESAISCPHLVTGACWARATSTRASLGQLFAQEACCEPALTKHVTQRGRFAALRGHCRRRPASRCAVG